MHSSLAKAFERSERERQKFLGLLRDLPDETLRKKTDPETWSLIQVATHLLGAEKGTLSYLRKKTSTPEALKKTGAKEAFRYALLDIANSLPLRFKTPPGVEQPANELSLAELLAQWDQLRSDLRQFLEAFPDAWLDKGVFRHPVVGMLRMKQSMGFLTRHIRHHRYQVHRIRKQL